MTDGNELFARSPPPADGTPYIYLSGRVTPRVG